MRDHQLGWHGHFAILAHAEAPTKAAPLAVVADPVAAPAPAALVIPKIGDLWPGQGGIYAGLSRGEDGKPDAHLILALAEPAGRLEWAAAVAWAKTVEAEGHNDFALPTRFESALLYANLRDKFDASAWYWTGTEYSGSYAWGQGFGFGSQYGSHKRYEGRARAVRRFVPSVL